MKIKEKVLNYMEDVAGVKTDYFMSVAIDLTEKLVREGCLKKRRYFKGETIKKMRKLMREQAREDTLEKVEELRNKKIMFGRGFIPHDIQNAIVDVIIKKLREGLG